MFETRSEGGETRPVFPSSVSAPRVLCSVEAMFKGHISASHRGLAARRVGEETVK